MSVNDAGRLTAGSLLTTIEGRVQLHNVSDAALAQRLTVIAEDVLRALSTSGELPGRVVVARQLDVASVLQPASPARIAQLIKAEVERVALDAVRGDDPASATAPMVYFKDEADVVRSLAQRVASNKPTTEWFWPSVVKGWAPNAPPERAITLLLERARSTPTSVVTLAHVVETLASTGVLDRVLERLSESDGRAWLEAIGWRESESSAERGEANSFTRPIPARSEQYVQRWVERWGGSPRDSRAVWLGAMLLVADRPDRATNPRLPEAVRVWLESVAADVSSQRERDGLDGGATRAMQRENLIADARAWLQSNPRSPLDSLFGGGPPFPLAPRDVTTPSNAVDRRDQGDESPAGERAPDQPPTWKNPRPTPYAGLTFLIPLLTRVGLSRIVANDRTLIDREWPAALLLRIARRLGVPLDDPTIAWSTARPLTIAHDDRSLTAEVIRASRIRARMEVGLTMRQLVHRTGAIVASSNRIDVFMQDSDVDPRVHRAALDADPGWVPWLGRTIQFHYLEAVDLNA